MRASIMRKAAKLVGSKYGSCWAIADAAGDYLFMHDAVMAVPEIQEWEAMHKPNDLADTNPFWLGPPCNREVDELRKVLLLEAALNLEAQGYDEELQPTNDSGIGTAGMAG